MVLCERWRQAVEQAEEEGGQECQLCCDDDSTWREAVAVQGLYVLLVTFRNLCLPCCHHPSPMLNYRHPGTRITRVRTLLHGIVLVHLWHIYPAFIDFSCRSCKYNPLRILLATYAHSLSRPIY